MINNTFFSQFLQLSNYITIIGILLLAVSLFVLKILKDKKTSFSTRMLIALLLGLALGIGIDLVFSNNEIYTANANTEIQVWYNLIGGSFLKLIQLLAVPVVFLSIIKVVIDVQGDTLKKLSGKAFTLLLGTTAISALAGILVVKIFNLENSSLAAEVSESRVTSMTNIAAQSFPEFFANLVPNNIGTVFSTNNSIVSVVIIAALFATAMRFLVKKKPEQVKPFLDFINSLRVVVNSVLTNIVKFMPYAIVALVSRTIINNGISSILSILNFIIAIYVGVIIMLIVYIFILIIAGINPIQFYKKAYSTLLFAFSSRSSVGTLPYTLKTLENMGVSGETGNFVATLGTTIGMNGCAGVFPAMLAVLVGAASGVVQIDFTFYVLTVLVVTVGSIGIAGVPGTATVAATVTLNGLGLGAAIDSIGAVFGIDPIIDMGRTMLNVAGAMLSAVVVDKWQGKLDIEKFKTNTIEVDIE
jgi:Predicted Na+/dicarboxylate symporter